MNILGLHLKLLIGQTTPAPAPFIISEALQSVQVTHSDQVRSGFQLNFQVGRGLTDIMDYALLRYRLLEPFNRVILVVYFNVRPQTLIDGIITQHQLSPGDDPGSGTLTVTGEDVSVMMDLEQRIVEYQNNDAQTLQTIIDRYRTTCGLRIENSTLQNANRTTDQPWMQSHMTDLAFVQQLAESYGYIFYIRPGSAARTNIAHWGPPIPNRMENRQAALSINMGPHTNVDSVSFQCDALAPERVIYHHQDQEQTPIDQPEVQNPQVQLARTAIPARRTVYQKDTGAGNQQTDQAGPRNRAQAMFNRSYRDPVTASGQLNALRYGAILEPRGLVDLRGAGRSYDGTYYVKSVTHTIDIRKGAYQQSFSLSREGLGTTATRVRG